MNRLIVFLLATLFIDFGTSFDEFMLSNRARRREYIRCDDDEGCPPKYACSEDGKQCRQKCGKNSDCPPHDVCYENLCHMHCTQSVYCEVYEGNVCKKLIDKNEHYGVCLFT